VEFERPSSAIVFKRLFDELHIDGDRAHDRGLHLNLNREVPTDLENQYPHSVEQVISAHPVQSTSILEAASGFEPEYGALQAPA
jgi:hypothetical protein